MDKTGGGVRKALGNPGKTRFSPRTGRAANMAMIDVSFDSFGELSVSFD